MKQDGYYISTFRGSKANRPYEMRKLDEANNIKKYAEFKDHVKTYFLSEALNYIFMKCISESVSNPEACRLICETFVNEEGYENLMRRFKTNTLITALIEETVNKATEKVIAKADKDDCLTWTINDSEQKKFFDSLKDLPVDKLTKVINQRVCDSAEEFVQRNINNKLDIEDIAGKTKERIEAAKAKYDEEKAASVQKEQMTIYKKAVNDIKNRSVRNVYEHMMNITSATVLENEQLRESYINESGKFDMGLVENQVHMMYTFMEMVNSLKLKKVDNKYIEECLSSIN